MAASEVDFIQVGDRIYLEAQQRNPETGQLQYLVGMSDSSLCAKELDYIQAQNGFWARSVFLVQAQSTWNKLQAYKSLLEQTGISALEAETHPETRTAFLEAALERSAHQSEFERARGRDVRYGSIIQLLHDSVGTFMSTTRHTASGSGFATASTMVLDANAGGECCDVLRCFSSSPSGEIRCC